MSKLLIESANAVRILKFNRPEKINAFDAELWQLFADGLNDADQDSLIKSVIVTGEGGNFSSGVDLESMVGEGGSDYERPFNNCIDALINFSKPLIAAASGRAVGGGATILLHFDYVFIDEDFKLKYPFAELGLVPELGSSYLLFDQLGYQKSFDVLTTSSWINAKQYSDLGLVTHICNDPLNKAIEKANELSMKPTSSLIETKRILKKFMQPSIQLSRDLEDAAMKKLYGSDENLKAVQAFFSK